jgi:3'-phosphoadenosine 5'-phosphosulfate sulfotransferase (PAPS reductase)/FAD synthetase
MLSVLEKLPKAKATALPPEEASRLVKAIETRDWSEYDRCVVAFSGGKDSAACVFAMLEAGFPRDRMELWHHEIDGQDEAFMDWPQTPDYCRKFAAAYGLPIYFSWKVGGFLREMNRDNEPTAPTQWEREDGTIGQTGGKGPKGTRGLFPQVSGDLKVRWCSAYLKIDVGATVVRNEPRFTGARTLFVTGERREESSNRSKYMEFERDRAWSNKRTVIRYRPVLDWGEEEVWDALRRNGVRPHVAYRSGFSRLSCAFCIFGNDDQWATLLEMFPEKFEKVAAREDATGKTIARNGKTIRERAAAGTSYLAKLPEDERAETLAECRTTEATEVTTDSETWTMPAGAFGDSMGPC